jgi:CRP/FNR family transcriptional regulator, anaerobic regulatory protein
MCEELSAVQDRLLLLGRKSAVERLASFLLTLAKRCVPTSGHTEVNLPMSRIDIADYLGLTVETVSRVLGQLRSRKLVDLKSVNHIVFLDRTRLEQISAGAALA